VLSSLVATGRSGTPAGPWLGVYLREVQGQLLVLRVSEGGPAATAGLLPGEVILGVDGHRVSSLEDFFRQVRSRGGAGADVPLDVLAYKDSDMSVRKLAVTSRDRHGWLRMGN